MHAQVARDERIWPSGVTARTPSLVTQLQARWAVASESIRLEIRCEIAGSVALVDRVDVFFEEAPRFHRI